MEIIEIMKQLSRERGLFHSEADFQHALACTIRQSGSGSQIRLEYAVHDVPEELSQKATIYIDILINQPKYAIEVKYKTRNLEATFNNERFRLMNQSAHDIARYDYLKDIMRLEWLVDRKIATAGCAIFLTNDPGYWRESNRETIDMQFRIHEGRKIQSNNPLSWLQYAANGTTKARERAITLKKNYPQLHWTDYSEPPVRENRSYNKFRYLFVEIRQFKQPMLFLLGLHHQK